jgi:outer membrane protein OmpA-like peptidoglycan-associated protein
MISVRRALLAALLCLTFSAAPAGAVPEAPHGYLTVLGGYAVFDPDVKYPTAALKDTYHAGGRLGWMFSPVLGLEAAGGWSPGEEDIDGGADVTFWHASGNIILTPFVWKSGGPFISAGGGYVTRNSDVAPDDLHFGTLEVAGGWMAWMGDAIGIRLEARNILSIPNKKYQSANKNDAIFSGGLTWAFGGTPRDADGDGVSDRKDACPDTPSGAVVDATGCPVDSDGDGVFDGLDQCANTPKGARVDAKGCPVDGDGDGVFDGIDQCADTPSGAKVDAKGCPTDGDGDGVFDGLDRCPDTPTGAKVDASGCPMDSDGDGIYDGLDKCPGTGPGLKVDKVGCPIEVTEKETELLDTGMIRINDINFETGKADIKADSYATLDVVGQLLNKWSQLKIEIGGHTDSRGSDALNQRLSNERAESVLDYLLKKFPDLDPSQYTSKGYGEGSPMVPNNSPLNMAKNRRVEFKVLNKDVLKNEVEKRRLLKEGEK